MRITVQNLTVEYTLAGGDTLPAVAPTSFDIASGSFVALLGPSGCGKSTVVRVLAGLLKPTSGHITLDGKPIKGASPTVGVMFQSANLMPWRTVVDNIALPLEMQGVSRDARYARVEALLPVLGLRDFTHAYPGELSGGMAQRAALGRVLIQSPRVLLLDEPFGALDAMTRERISLDLLRVWAHSQPTVVMVTHDINEAVLLADRVLVMSRRPGHIIADLAVPLSRPRTLDMIYTPPFIETAKQVRAAIDRA